MSSISVVFAAIATQNRYGDIPMPTAHTWKYPGLCALLLRFLRYSIHDKQHLVSAIQVTKNLQTREHVDSNNDGPSYGVVFGSFTGGSLWEEDEAGTYYRTLEEDIFSWPATRYTKG